MEDDSASECWQAYAAAWIDLQGEEGDRSRAEILDSALDTMLGSVGELEILDVGCGEGRYARKLATRGAVVTGVDPVSTFIERARARHPAGTYIRGSGEVLPFADQSFDMVLSYLSIIDIPDYRRAIREMARVLRPHGRIVVVTISNIASPSADGWFRDSDGRKLHRAIDRYMEEFTLNLNWGGMNIKNFHRPLSAILGAFFETGLVLDGFVEPLPPPNSSLYADEFRAPNFQIMTFQYSAASPAATLCSSTAGGS